MEQTKPLTNGPAAAAILASGIGCLTLGLLTTLVQALAPAREALNFYSPTGPMSGKTILATAVWLVAWAMLHFLWRSEQVNFGRIFHRHAGLDCPRVPRHFPAVLPEFRCMILYMIQGRIITLLPFRTQ